MIGMKSAFVALICLAASLVAPARASAVAVSGHVTDSSGTAVANVQVAFLVTGTGSPTAATITDGTGAYAVDVNPGTYDVHLTPPPDSAFVPQILPERSIVSTITLDLVLVPTSSTSSAVYSGQVLDRNGLPLATGIIARLCPTAGGNCFQSALDAAGNFSLQVPTGNYEFQVTAYYVPSNAPPLFTLFRSLTLNADASDTYFLQNRTVTGNVAGPNGPVANAQVSASGNTSFGGLAGNWSGGAITDAGGNFQFAAFAGDVSIAVTPPQGSGAAQGSTSVDATNDASINITLAPGLTFDGQLIDRNGAPVQSATAYLCQSGNCAFGVTADAQGSFSFEAGPGDYSLRIIGQIGAPVSFTYDVSRPLTLLQNTSQIISIPDRVMSGFVRDPTGTPMANLVVSFNFFGVAFDGFTGSFNGTTFSDSGGAYQLAVLPGTGTLQVAPNEGRGVGLTAVDITVVGDLALDITLLEAFSLQLHMQDRDGSPLPTGAAAFMCPQGGGPPCSLQFFDAQGNATLQTIAGSYGLTLSGSFPGSPDLPASFQLNRPVVLTQNALETIMLPNRRLSGAVVDPDGIPVASVTLGGSFSAPPSGGDSWSSNASGTTDGNGNFAMGVLSGSGTLQGTPAAASGLAPFAIQGVSIEQDLVLGVFLQFVTETVSGTVGDDGTVGTDTEGDGATPADPIETAVTSPNGGDIQISESPIALSPPGHFQFLTQQIEIIAPQASTVHPLVLVFRIDASRIPPDKDQNSLQVLRDGKPVKNCTGPPGIAFEDPCVSLRALLGDGDVQLTVLSSHASAWNIGVGDQPCLMDTDCTDAIGCTEDVCVNGFCASLPQDATCSNGAPCDGVERCYPSTGCGPGSAVVCADDGDTCTDNVCDPSIGACAPLPHTCTDDNDSCTTEICDMFQYGGCFSHLTTFQDGQCELDHLVATPFCTAMNASLQAKIERKVASAHKRLDRVLGVTDARKGNRAVNSVQRKLGRLYRKIYKLQAKGQLSQECFDAVLQRLGQTQGILNTLYRF